MALHWNPPPQGALKINIHGCSSVDNNDSGFAAINRDTAGGLRHIILGIISGLTPLENQLWTIFIALKRAFLEGYQSVILETDNLTAFRVIKGFNVGASAGIYDIVSQIDILLNDPRWVCSLDYVFPSRNRVAIYASRMSMEVCDMIYTFDKPVGGVEELVEWDMGLGLDHPDFFDEVIPHEAPHPADFGVALTLADQIENLGVGQIAAPEGVVLDVEMNENPNELNEVMKEIYQVGIMVGDVALYAGEVPVLEVD